MHCPPPPAAESTCPKLEEWERKFLSEYVKSSQEQRQSTLTFYSGLPETSRMRMRPELLWALRWLLTA